MKKSILTAIIAACAISASAENEVLTIQLQNGTTQTYQVADIKRITFDAGQQEETLDGTYSGAVTMVIGGQFTYNTTASCTLTTRADGTMDVTINEYKIDNTVMGNLILGSITINGLTYDESKGGYYKDYGSDGLTRHFTVVGNSAMDKDYDVSAGSTLLVQATADGIKVVDSFRMGAMPFPIVATLEGKK